MTILNMCFAFNEAHRNVQQAQSFKEFRREFLEKTLEHIFLYDKRNFLVRSLSVDNRASESGFGPEFSR